MPILHVNIPAPPNTTTTTPPQVDKTRVRVREMKAALTMMQALHRGEDARCFLLVWA